MIDEDKMHELGRMAPVGVNRPVADIIGPGQRLRRRRQVTRTAGGLLAVLAVVGAVTQIPRDRQVTAASQPGPATRPEGCSSGGIDEPGPEAVEGIRFLPSWLPSGTEITNADAYVILTATSTCAQVPTALVLGAFDDSDPSRVDRAVLLRGPSPARFNLDNMVTLNEPVEVRGTQGTLIQVPMVPGEPGTQANGPFTDRVQLVWTEGDGSSWELTGHHLSSDELIGLANGLLLDSSAETPASATSLDGLQVLYQRTSRPTPTPAEIPQWRVCTGSGDGEIQYTIEVSRTPNDVNPAIDLIANGYNTQTVNVRGHLGISRRVSEDGHTGGGSLTWDEAPDINVQIQGPGDIDTLIRIAESLTPVPSDDPRIREVSEPGRH